MEFGKRQGWNLFNARGVPSKYQLILDNASELVALLGADGFVQYVNPHIEKTLGYRVSEVIGRNIFEFVHPDDAPRAAQEYSVTIQAEGERIPSVLRLRDSNGGWVPFEVIANNRLKHPGLRAVVLTARDLRFQKEITSAIQNANLDTEKSAEERTTEMAKINAELRIENQARRQVERQLKYTISLLNATLDSTADGILVVSSNGRITSCNKQFMEMWRLECGSAVTKDDRALLNFAMQQLQSPDDFLEKVRSLYADPTATSFDVLHFKDGRILERYSQPERMDDKIVGRVWSFRDVTHARNLEMELRQSQKMEALGRLAGGIAHDFNNLLMLISGYVNQMLSDHSEAERRALAEQALASTKRAASVTKQLLAFSRKLPATPSATDLNLIVLNMENMLRRLLSDQIELQISLSESPQPVFVDVSQIEVLLINLAVNAQDAMPDGGLLSIGTAPTTPWVSPQKVKGHGENFAVLQVSDTGHGMPEGIQAHIFEPFFTTKEVGKGTGLGLSTVFGIIERAGGSIEVQSAPGEGSAFRIYLPKVEAAAEESPKVSAALPGGGNETILLAEDESGIRTMTRAYLESLGYHVLEAADGSEAIRRSLEYPGVIDLVLTDILMPGIRGDVAVEEIRRHRPAIQSILMSGYADQDAIDYLKNILNKPFEFPELGRRLRTLLDAPSAEHASSEPAA